MARIWYTKYDELTVSIKERRTEYLTRCKILDANPNNVLKEVWHELIARAVKESNWQEGLKLNEPRTQRMATEALYIKSKSASLRIDTNAIMKQHRRHVTKLQRRSLSEEEIGAFNLSAAYHIIPTIGLELASRQISSLAKAIREIYKETKSRSNELPPDVLNHLEKGIKIVEYIEESDNPTVPNLNESIATEGEYVKRLIKEDMSDLMNPMTAEYINFLHRLTLAGLYPASVCGRYRKEPVHIGNKEVMFPSPSLVPGLMKEFCRDFPSLASTITKYEPILKAAEISYRFVEIHPYLDGNGRVSRLLMNLVLCAHGHPPVYLKADKKGRHRYSVALKRANRGDYKPLACLIAISLEEIYCRLLRTVK